MINFLNFVNFTIIIVKFTIFICIGTCIVDFTCPSNLPKNCKLLERSIVRPSYAHHFTKGNLANNNNNKRIGFKELSEESGQN